MQDPSELEGAKLGPFFQNFRLFFFVRVNFAAFKNLESAINCNFVGGGGSLPWCH